MHSKPNNQSVTRLLSASDEPVCSRNTFYTQYTTLAASLIVCHRTVDKHWHLVIFFLLLCIFYVNITFSVYVTELAVCAYIIAAIQSHVTQVTWLVITQVQSWLTTSACLCQHSHYCLLDIPGLCNACHIFHRQVWYHAISLCCACICVYSKFRHHRNPLYWTPLCQISFLLWPQLLS